MSNIDKRPFRADGGDISTGRLKEIADNPYGDEEKCWLAKRVLALLDELEAKDKLNAELMEKLRLIDICQGQGLEHRIAAEKRAEAAEKRVAELECITGALRVLRPGHITIAGEKIGIYMRDEVDTALNGTGAGKGE